MVRDVGTDHVELIVLAGVGFWIGIGLLIARIGGWAALAAAYSHSGEFQGERLRFQTAQVRWGTNYGGCLTIGANHRGLFLSVLFLFRIGHPPLFIPWTDISVSDPKGRWFSYVELRFRRAPSIPLRVSEQLTRWLADRAATSWPGRG